MVSQTNAVNSADQPLKAVARSSSEFADEFFSLAELQTRLLMLESREYAGRAQSSLLLIVGGALLLGTLIPLALLTLAALLMEVASLTLAQALASALLIGAVAGLTLVIVGYQTLRKLPEAFPRTVREWSANSRWLHNMIRRQGRRW